MPAAVNAQKPIRQRVVWLDYAKAIGIFFVVWGHMCKRVSYSLELGNVIERFIYAFHMPLFFMLSGIVMGYQLPEKEEINISTEIKKYAKRLLVPYVFWCVVYLPINCAQGIVHGHSILSTALSCIYATLTGIMAPMWFLYTLFMIEALFLLIWKCLKNKGIEKSIFVWGGVLLAAAVITAALDAVYKHYQCETLPVVYLNIIQTTFRFFPTLFFFAAGYIGVLAASWTRVGCFGIKHRPFLMIFCTALFLVLQLSVGAYINIFRFRFDNSAVLALLIALPGSGAVIFATQMLSQNLTFLQKIGRESMHIMVLHYGDLQIPHIIAILWIALIPSSIPYTGFTASVINLLISYACAVYLFEPLCRRAKARFRAKAK